MIVINILKYGLFLVFSKTIILLFVFSSFANADNQIKILMLGDSLTQGYGLTEKNGLVPALQRWLSINNVEVLLINGETVYQSSFNQPYHTNDYDYNSSILRHSKFRK